MKILAKCLYWPLTGLYIVNYGVMYLFLITHGVFQEWVDWADRKRK